MLPRLCDCLRSSFLHGSPASSTVVSVRRISSSEIATALRPFYFAVHPDLFGRHPKQRSTNEESLKHLSAHLEALRQRRLAQTAPKVLMFYIRHKADEDRDHFKLIRISLEHQNDAKLAIKKILESCNLSTQYVDSIKSMPSHTNASGGFQGATPQPYYSGDINYGADFNDFYSDFRYKQEEKETTLRSWLEANVKLARSRTLDLEDLVEEVSKLQTSLADSLQLKEVRYDCGWNYEHYRGCLKTLERLSLMHAKHMDVLKGRIVVFAPFTGVSLEGHVMLFTGDVLNNWLDFIKNIPKHDSFLTKIPSYEFALSQVLRNIRIGRRKFMPKQQAVGYAGHLTKVTTTLLDYLSSKKFPKSWPSSLEEFEIVVESEAGPLMISPTGQIILPATCPGFMLVDFITNHLDEAREKADQYKKNKLIEQSLHSRCMADLNLKSLNKDDSVTPEKMIKTMENLLLASSSTQFSQIHLNVTNYYSVLTDGTVCIPWDFKLE